MIGVPELINNVLGAIEFVLGAVFVIVLVFIVLFGTGILKLDKTIAEYFDDGWDGSEPDTSSNQQTDGVIGS